MQCVWFRCVNCENHQGRDALHASQRCRAQVCMSDGQVKETHAMRLYEVKDGFY